MSDWKTETRPRVVAAFMGAEGYEINVLSDGSWWQQGSKRKWYQVAPAMTSENMVPLEAPEEE